MDDQTPKVAILLAAFNGIKSINQQVDSILLQKGTQVTIYISVDKSSDGTNRWIDLRAKGEFRLVILPYGNIFGNAAQNFFRLVREVDLSEYSYIAFSDQDDIWLPEKLTSALHTIKNQNADGYSSNVTAFWPSGRQKLVSKAQPQTHYDYMFESAGPGCSFVLTQKLALTLQKKLREEEHNLQNIALHDWFIYAFARSKGYKWYIDPTPTLLYRQHADNVVGANIGLKAVQVRLLKLNQGWYLQQILLIAKELGYQQSSPIKKIMRLNIWDRCYLAIFSYQYRRRLRDRFAFAFFILFLARKS